MSQIQMTLMQKQKITSLAAWRDRETAKLVAYLQKRLDTGTVGGLVVQSIDHRGKERIHMTGIYAKDREKALSAALALSIRMTAHDGGFQDSVFE